MQRRSDKKSPQVLFSRGGSDWIRRVGQKHKQLLDLLLSEEQKDKLDRWAETEFVYSTLNLEGANLTREHIARVASRPLDAPAVDDRAPIAAALAALRRVASMARANGRAAELTGEVLLDLHGEPGGGFRRDAGDTSRAVKPAPPEHLLSLIVNACQWWTAESFAELNPVEQASIVLLRLIDLQPFEQGNERTALVAASLFTLRSGLPPIIIRPEIREAFRHALDEATRMNTQPMVELIAGAIERSVGDMIERAEKGT